MILVVGYLAGVLKSSPGTFVMASIIKSALACEKTIGGLIFNTLLNGPSRDVSMGEGDIRIIEKLVTYENCVPACAIYHVYRGCLPTKKV